MCESIINKYQIYWYNFDTVSFFVAEDINTPICGKEEDGCVKLARSECSNINFQLIFCTFALHISNSANNGSTKLLPETIYNSILSTSQKITFLR
jgi:hypothetical protein